MVIKWCLSLFEISTGFCAEICEMQVKLVKTVSDRQRQSCTVADKELASSSHEL